MSNIRMTQDVVRIHLTSWRYFACLTLPALIFIVLPPYRLVSVLLLILFLLTHYYCWRLWLDERLFGLLQSDDDLVHFDNGMRKLWRLKSAEPRSLDERWQGARKLFFRAGGSLLLLWLVMLYRLLWLAAH